MSRTACRLTLVAIVAVYVALFARTVGYAYVWDDDHTIRDSNFFERPLSEQLRTTEMQRIDASPIALAGMVRSHDSYRPITLFDQAMDVRLFGRGSPAPMHVHSLALGAIAMLVAFALARRLLRSAPAALAVAALFAIHPLHVEPFAYISARADLLAGLFALLALWAVVELAPPGEPVRGRRARVALSIAAALALVAAMFAKESAIGTPLVALAIGLAVGRARAWAPGIAAMVVALGGYAVLRHLLVTGAASPTTPEHAVAAIRALPAVTTQYAASFFAPFDLSVVQPRRVPDAVGWIVVAGILVAAVALRRARRWSPDHTLITAFAASALLLVGPSAVAVMTLRAYASRYAYLPELAFSLALVAAARLAIARGGAIRTGVLAAGALWAALLVVVTVRETPAWASDDALFSHAIALEPDSGFAYYHLGMLRLSAHDWPAATAALERSIELAPDDDRAVNSLAVCYMNQGRLDDAEPLVRRALALTHETSFRAWYNLATIQRARGAMPDACASLAHALTINPGYDRASAEHDRDCR